MFKHTIVFAALGLSACQALVPNTISPYVEHMSHATQHEPFTDHPTSYGADIIGLSVGYSLGHNLRLDLSEGYTLEHYYPNSSSYGEIVGPREEFTGRLSYQFTVKP